MFLVTFLSTVVQILYVFVWDFVLALINIVTFNRRRGRVTPRGTPGAEGEWPAYVAPKAGDSRSACPALNALANHGESIGILPHDGKNIRFNELSGKVDAAFNTAPSVSSFVTNLAVRMLKRNYKRDTFDLAELDLHNGIEHDASLTREDSALVPNQSKPNLLFVEKLLASASGRDRHGKSLRLKDISAYSAKRRVDSRAANSGFSLDLFHKLIGSLNASFFLTIFGGRVGDLQSILIEERIPEGWESRVRSRKGLTFTASIFKILGIEIGTIVMECMARIAAALSST